VGENWYRWRLLHAGPFFFMDLSLEPEVPGTVRCEMLLVAKDGVYLPVMPRVTDRVILPPAGRADVIVRCEGHGKLRLVSGARPGASGRWSGALYWNPVIAVIDVVGSPGGSLPPRPPPPPPPFNISRPVYVLDTLARPASDIDGEFEMRFTGATIVDEALPTGLSVEKYPKNGGKSGTCLINGLSYQKGAPIGRWLVNTLQEWIVSGLQTHPLHLHINPFQVAEVGSIGATTTFTTNTSTAATVATGCDDEFGYTCVGDWLDTIMLPTGSTDREQARFRFVTDTFTGHEVIHCHYLNHEDLGCLTYFEIEERGRGATKSD
jgi:FtsP/CotA-like multicopper oxidase with cupredoxin domain